MELRNTREIANPKPKARVQRGDVGLRRVRGDLLRQVVNPLPVGEVGPAVPEPAELGVGPGGPVPGSPRTPAPDDDDNTIIIIDINNDINKITLKVTPTIKREHGEEW